MRLEVIVAPNPGLMTGPGTNTWVVESEGESVVLDPGPMIQAHLDRVRTALGRSKPVGVVVTHAHPDHALAANPLSAELGVPTIARSDGPDLVVERIVAEGDEIRFGALALAVIATPGHTADSTSYRLDDGLFTGDHIMGGSTVVVEEMVQYMASLERLSGIGLTRLYPGHGPAIEEPDETIGRYIEHRRAREAEILRAVGAGATSVAGIVEAVYRDVDRLLHPVAAVSVSAHLRKLAEQGQLEFDEPAGTVGSGRAR